MKYHIIANFNTTGIGRSREGAWIEITGGIASIIGGAVAPVRERGLKCNTAQAYAYINRRSREGAWIEIALLRHPSRRIRSLP